MLLFVGCLDFLFLVGWLVGWLIGWLVGWLIGWLVGWLVGWFGFGCVFFRGWRWGLLLLLLFCSVSCLCEGSL